MNKKNEAINEAAECIRQQCPISDIGGRMVLAAFFMDSINQRYPDETKAAPNPLGAALDACDGDIDLIAPR